MGSLQRTLNMIRHKLIALVVLPAAVFGVHIKNPSNPDSNTRASWGYQPSNGPATWPSTYATCAGSSQSPINIDTSAAKDCVAEIIFTNYRQTINGTVTNNNHTASFTYSSGNLPVISGNRFANGESYKFLQFHWHWGSVNTQGSEHTLDGREFPAEIHLVHWNTKYPDVATAVQNADGLAVIGFFYEISATDNLRLNDMIDAINTLSTCTNVRKRKGKKGKKGKLQKFERDCLSLETFDLKIRLDDFIPAVCETDEFYYYQGGLTTPTCDEVVSWNVFTKTIPISTNQLAVLRTLVDSSGVTLNDNYRPPQPLNGRTVCKRSSTTSSTTSITKDKLTAAKVTAGFTGTVIGALAMLVVAIIYLGLIQTETSRTDHHQLQYSEDTRYFHHSRPNFAK